MTALNNPYKKQLYKGATAKTFERAQDLRMRLTPSEALLWERLRNHRLKGLKFRRQHPVKRFILDFYCPEYRLALEVDGGIHDQANEKLYDTARTAELEKLQIQVIRFTNEEVTANMDQVLKRILEYITRK